MVLKEFIDKFLELDCFNSEYYFLYKIYNKPSKCLSNSYNLQSYVPQ